MNIKSLLIAAVVACTGTMVANAQNPEILSNESALAQSVCGNNECGPKSKCNKGECAAFEGLNLTDAQKTALAQLKADRKNKAIEAKKQKRQADSLSRVARRAERLDYLHQIQKILTPDQYVTFLENTIVNNGGGKGCKPGKPGKLSKLLLNIKPWEYCRTFLNLLAVHHLKLKGILPYNIGIPETHLLPDFL